MQKINTSKSYLEISLDWHDLQVINGKLPITHIQDHEIRKILQISFIKKFFLGIALSGEKRVIKNRYVKRKRLISILKHRKRYKKNKSCVRIIHANTEEAIIF